MGRTVKLREKTIEKLKQHKSPGQSWDGVVREVYSKSEYTEQKAKAVQEEKNIENLKEDLE